MNKKELLLDLAKTSDVYKEFGAESAILEMLQIIALLLFEIKDYETSTNRNLAGPASDGFFCAKHKSMSVNGTKCPMCETGLKPEEKK